MRKYLLGVLETFLFMNKAHERFSDDRSAAIRSFLVPALAMPFVILISVLNSEGYSPVMLASVHGVRLLIELSLSLGFLYAMSGILEARSGFWRYIAMSNWFNIALLLLMSPVLFGIVTQMSMDLFTNYLIFLTLYSVVMTAFMLAYTLKTNWQLASFMAITCLFISQTMLQLTTLVRDTIV